MGEEGEEDSGAQRPDVRAVPAPEAAPDFGGAGGQALDAGVVVTFSEHCNFFSLIC